MLVTYKKNVQEFIRAFKPQLEIHEISNKTGAREYLVKTLYNKIINFFVYQIV